MLCIAAAPLAQHQGLEKVELNHRFASDKPGLSSNRAGGGAEAAAPCALLAARQLRRATCLCGAAAPAGHPRNRQGLRRRRRTWWEPRQGCTWRQGRRLLPGPCGAFRGPAQWRQRRREQRRGREQRRRHRLLGRCSCERGDDCWAHSGGGSRRRQVQQLAGEGRMPIAPMHRRKVPDWKCWGRNGVLWTRKPCRQHQVAVHSNRQCQISRTALSHI